MRTKIINKSNCDAWKGCVLTYGHFSTIHVGHIRYLRHARTLGERMVVALVGDNSPDRYPFTQKERAEGILMLGVADGILLLESDELSDAINQLKPTVLVLGNEYKEYSNLEATLNKQREQGGVVQFHAGEIHYATAELLAGSERDLRESRKQSFSQACKKQEIKKDELVRSMDAWSNCNLIVLGDTIVDQYAACEAIGMSAEAPVVVVRELEHKNFIGGAAVVAAHISALGAKCNLVSVVGDDSAADLVSEELSRQGIGNNLTTDPTRPTTFKKRYIVENQKLFRVSRLEEHNLESHAEEEIIKTLYKLAPKANGIVVSDFVYGVITPRILKEVQFLANKYQLMLFGDLQCSSQMGEVTKFKNFTLICPNEREARLALKDKDSGLEQISQKLLDLTECEAMIMKLGSEGFIAYEKLDDGELRSQQFPALSVNPLDVAGAGDSLLALFATSLASDQKVMPTAALACCMAAIAVETMGNTPIDSQSLKQYLRETVEQ